MTILFSITAFSRTETVHLDLLDEKQKPTTYVTVSHDHVEFGIERKAHRLL